MQAIITKFICPTNTRGSQYKATCKRGSLTVSADDSLSAEENHRAVCDQLCAQFDAKDAKKYGGEGLKNDWKWSRPKASGQIRSGEHVFCFIPDRVYQRTEK